MLMFSADGYGLLFPGSTRILIRVRPHSSARDTFRIQRPYDRAERALRPVQPDSPIPTVEPTRG